MVFLADAIVDGIPALRLVRQPTLPAPSPVAPQSFMVPHLWCRYPSWSLTCGAAILHGPSPVVPLSFMVPPLWCRYPSWSLPCGASILHGPSPVVPLSFMVSHLWCLYPSWSLTCGASILHGPSPVVPLSFMVPHLWCLYPSWSLTCGAAILHGPSPVVPLSFMVPHLWCLYPSWSLTCGAAILHGPSPVVPLSFMVLRSPGAAQRTSHPLPNSQTSEPFHGFNPYGFPHSGDLHHTSRSPPPWALQVDDDVYLNVERLLQATRQWDAIGAGYIGCMKHGDTYDDPDARWYEPQHEIIGPTYFLHAFGSIYALVGAM